MKVNCPDNAGSALIALIGAMVVMALLTAGIMMLFNTALLETAETSSSSAALFTAETGLSIGKAYCRSNSAWFTNVPFTLEGSIGPATYSAVVTTGEVSIIVTTSTVWSAGAPGSWSSDVAEGWSCGGGNSLSTLGILGNIQSDNGDGRSAGACYADRGSLISDLLWFSVYFANTLPTNAAIIDSARIYVDHEGTSKKRGNLVVHVSDSKTTSGWYTGATGASGANSGDVAWDQTEQRYTYDVTAVLNTADKINNCEALVLNNANSRGILYFDYMYIAVDYFLPGTPTTVMTTSIVPYAVVTSTGRKNDAEWTSAWTGLGATTRSRSVDDGWSCGYTNTLSGAGILSDIQTDADDGASGGVCFSDAARDIAALQWFSVYFGNDLSTNVTKVNSVKICIDHEGSAGQSGDFVIHVSTNRNISQWYAGNTGDSDAESGNVAWNETEQRYEYDATSVLDTIDKINDCEVLMLNVRQSSDKVYFDYIYMEVDYY